MKQLPDKIIGEGYHSAHTGIPGWQSAAEGEFFTDIARTVPAGGTIGVVGVEYGCCTSELAKASAKDVKVYAIDMFPETHHIAKQYHVGLVDIFIHNLTKVNLINKVEVHRGLSTVVGSQWPGPQFDVLVIDAGHHYDEVKADIATWWPHVKVGGRMVFHDYAKRDNAHYLHRDVKRAVDEKFGDRVTDATTTESIVYVVKTEADEKEAIAHVKQPDELSVPLFEDEIEGMSVIESDFTQIKGIGKTTAEVLYAAEVWTFQELVDADVLELSEDTDIPVSKLEDWQKQARLILKDE